MPSDETPANGSNGSNGDNAEEAIRVSLEDGDFDAAMSMALSTYGAEILGFLCATMRDPNDADDAYAAGCHDAWRGIETYRAQSTFRAWLYGVFRNAAARFYRDAFRKRQVPFSRTPASSLVALDRTRTRPFLKTDVKNAFRELRAELPTVDQELLVLRIDRALSWPEITDVLATEGAPSSAALRKRFERVKEKVRQLALERGLLQ